MNTKREDTMTATIEQAEQRIDELEQAAFEAHLRGEVERECAIVRRVEALRSDCELLRSFCG